METAEGCSDMGAPFLQCTAALLVIGSGHSLAAGARPASPRASVPSGDHPPFFSCSLPRPHDSQGDRTYQESASEFAVNSPASFRAAIDFARGCGD